MAVAVIQPRGEKESSLDKIAKGLNIANSVLGIGTSFKDLEEKQKDSARKEAEFQAQNDPNSPIAQMVRERAKAAGIEVRDDVTYSQFTKSGLADQVKQAEDFKNQSRLVDLKNKSEAGEKQAGFARDLRKERNELPITKATQVVVPMFDKVLKAAEDPSAGGDVSLVFGFMKMLDPGSVVRESEYATAQNAAGVPDRIRNLFNRIQSGERLTPEQRADFVQQARNAYAAQLDTQRRVDEQFTKIAEQMGIDPKNVIVEFGERPDPLKLAKPQQKGMGLPGLPSANASSEIKPPQKMSDEELDQFLGL